MNFKKLSVLALALGLVSGSAVQAVTSLDVIDATKPTYPKLSGIPGAGLKIAQIGDGTKGGQVQAWNEYTAAWDKLRSRSTMEQGAKDVRDLTNGGAGSTGTENSTEFLIACSSSMRQFLADRVDWLTKKLNVIMATDIESCAKTVGNLGDAMHVLHTNFDGKFGFQHASFGSTQNAEGMRAQVSYLDSLIGNAYDMTDGADYEVIGPVWLKMAAYTCARQSNLLTSNPALAIKMLASFNQSGLSGKRIDTSAIKANMTAVLMLLKTIGTKAMVNKIRAAASSVDAKTLENARNGLARLADTDSFQLGSADADMVVGLLYVALGGEKPSTMSTTGDSIRDNWGTLQFMGSGYATNVRWPVIKVTYTPQTPPNKGANRTPTSTLTGVSLPTGSSSSGSSSGAPVMNW